MNIPLWAWGLSLLASGVAHAHPVAFQGSVGIMGTHSKGMTDNEVNYSLRHWIAPSVRMVRISQGNRRPDFALGKLNVLARRWNGRDYQANIYLHGGAGYSYLSRGELYHGGITADIEDRKLYFLTQWDLFRNSRRTEAVFWKVRAGFAPYLGHFDAIHSWFIVEANRKSTEGRINIVPTLRFFHQNVLWEVGASLSGELNLNYIIHI